MNPPADALPEKYSRLKELSEKATKGPWKKNDKHRGIIDGENGIELAVASIIMRPDEDGQFITEARNQIDSLLEDLETACAALEFYSAPKHPGKDWPKGTRIEFGCGCCAGTIEEDKGISDYDKSIVGATAREALNKIRGIDATRNP